MNALVWLTVASGIAASAFCILALRAARQHKQQNAQTTVFLTSFWGTVAAYMISFTVLRIAYGFHADPAILNGIYCVQTLSGASTVISLAAIMFGVLLRPWWGGFVTGIFLGLAVLTVFLIFQRGADIVVQDSWSIEFLPVAIEARVLVAVVYVIMPVAMGALVTFVARKAEPVTKTRFLLFSTSVVLMYIPNAIKYVFVFEAAANFVLAFIMTIGTYIGWRSYVPAIKQRQT